MRKDPFIRNRDHNVFVKNKPYIGVTGFMRADEIVAVTECWYEAWGERPITHNLMVGVLASAKTIGGLTNRYPLRYPKLEDLAPISRGTQCEPSIRGIHARPIGQDNTVVSFLHYAANAEGNLVAELDTAIALAGDWFDGMQINIADPWPHAAAFAEFRRHQPFLRLVLQLAPGNHGIGAVDSLSRDFQGFDDILVDVSAGRGVEGTTEAQERARDLIVALQATNHWRVGYGGGLSAEALDGWRADLLRRGCSIDIEGKVRDDAPGGGNLDPVKVRAYLTRAVEIVTAREATDAL